MKPKKMLTVTLTGLFLFTGALSVMADKPRAVPKENLDGIGATLAKQFTFEPFHPAMPDHLWMDAGGGRVSFLNFDRPVSEKGANLIFIGEGIKGRFCAEDQPDGGKTGYVHFHDLAKPAGAEHGHGGHKAAEGYWLRHIAVGKFEMMGSQFSPGIAHQFMPTKASRCS